MADETQATPLKTAPRHVVVEVYRSIPSYDRNHAAVNAKLAKQGYKPVAKASLYRWTGKAERLPPEIVSQAAVVPTIMHADEAKVTLEGIPRELVDALGARLLVVAKGEGLDKVESAIVMVASAIAAKADQIADSLFDTAQVTEEVTQDGDKVSAKKVSDAASGAMNAVQALRILAEAVGGVVKARTLFSVAHRNFAESDRLTGEGEKYQAEAETMRNAARADNARNITPEGAGGFEDAGVEDEAMATLHDVERRK